MDETSLLVLLVTTQRKACAALPSAFYWQINRYLVQAAGENMKGTITDMYPGYCFIQGEDGKSRFMFAGAIQQTSPLGWKDFKEGMVVEFIPIDDNRKRGTEKCIEVRPIGL